MCNSLKKMISKRLKELKPIFIKFLKMNCTVADRAPVYSRLMICYDSCVITAQANVTIYYIIAKY